MAYSYLHERTTRRDGYPRLYVFEAYQYAGLRTLANSSTSIASQARVILRERYELGLESPDHDPPKGFPDPKDSLGTKTFFTELVEHTDLRERLWPYDETASFEDQFREREQRRELLSAMARLGGAYVDLYLLAIHRLESFDLRAATDVRRPEELLIDDYLKLLESQMRKLGEAKFHAYRELSAAANAFESLVAVNFPEVRDARMSEYATIFARTLQHQEPVGRMFGGVNKRLVKQFRMPGYPLILATTDVLQEGEDLHTFCRRVIHYGITWTPSAMEQRTGRVDRIGSLVQRELDGANRVPQSDELIQVHYPHLSDTVERLQVRRVLQRLNQFLRLIHKTAPTSAGQDCRLDVAREILQAESAIPRIEGLLESDFPVAPTWLKGDAVAKDVVRPELQVLEQHFHEACKQLVSRLGIDVLETHKRLFFQGRMAIADRRLIPWEQRGKHKHYREQPFQLVLKSQSVGDATLVRCISPVGLLDLKDDNIIDELYDLQRDLGMIRVCARFDIKHRRYDTTVETDRLFHIDTTQNEELEDMLVRNVLAADRIEEELLQLDTRSDIWLSETRKEPGYE